MSSVTLYDGKVTLDFDAESHGLILPEKHFYRFISRIKASEDGCWEWSRGKISTGYGLYSVGYKRYYTHRLSYELFVGPIPESKHVLHSCDNPPCCNPEHLSVGTPLDNTNDAITKGRLDNKGSKNGRSKLTESIVLEIRNTYTKDTNIIDISNKYEITTATCRAILRGSLWKHVGGPLYNIQEYNRKYPVEVIDRIKEESKIISRKEIIEKYNISESYLSQIINDRWYK